MPAYFIQSFGCRSNLADSDNLDAALRQAGGHAAVSVEEADVVILNTCAVTAQAERDARAAVRRTRNRNPAARIVMTGCYAQRAPQDLEQLPGVSAVVGNSHKALTPGITLAPQQGWVAASALGAPTVLHAPFSSGHIAGEHAGSLTLPVAHTPERTRPVLRVQEGCGNRCSFCIIPETRGPSRSVPAERVLHSVQRLVAAGAVEIVLSGINMGRWGRELPVRGTLASLVRLLIEQTELPRLRLSSVEPMDWDDEMLALFSEHAAGVAPRLAPHAHLPLQSGADAILRRMHRRYRPWHYAEKLQRLHAVCPEAALGADVMTGFPGETDALFEENCAFLERMPLTYLHLFPYSPRPGTPAAAWHAAAPVPVAAVRERMHALEDLGRRKHRAHLERALGAWHSAVSLKGGRAVTANFLPVRLSQEIQPNRMLRLRPASIEGDILVDQPF